MRKLRADEPVQVGPYRIVARIGGGGMGCVYVGRSAGGWPVAVKVIRDELAEDPQFRARFAREVAAARRVSGLFTAPVVDADTDGAVPWLATAYVAGPSLADAVREHGPLPAQTVRTLAARLAEGLAAIHKAGMVHRDLKPSNVLLAADGPRVIDFGISHALEESTLTETGTVLGSPGFMSPEQAATSTVSPASDVFSLGAVLAFAATGKPPFGSGATAALVYRVVYEPDLTGVPPELRRPVERCLTKDPAKRPTVAGLLAEFAGTSSTAEWLPAAVTATLGRYEAPAAPVPEHELPEAGSPGLPRTRFDTYVVSTSAPPTNLAPTATATAPATPGRRRRRRTTALAAPAVLAVLAAAGVWLGTRPNGPPATVSSTISVPAGAPWSNTRISLKAGQQVTLTASGKASYGKNDPIGPGGIPGCTSATWPAPANNPTVAPALPCASLVGRIGANGTAFEVGTSTTRTATTSGQLYLSMNDWGFTDNSGNWTVHIKITG